MHVCTRRLIGVTSHSTCAAGDGRCRAFKLKRVLSATDPSASQRPRHTTLTADICRVTLAAYKCRVVLADTTRLR